MLQGDALAAKPGEVYSGRRIVVRAELRAKRNDVAIERHTRHSAEAGNSAVASRSDAASFDSAFNFESCYADAQSAWFTSYLSP